MAKSATQLTNQLTKNRSQVDVEYFDITLREMVRMVKDKEIILDPAYQRKFRWNVGQESKLIESCFLGLPIPSVFVASNEDGTWEVIDGVQRVSTIVHFSAKELGDLDTINKDEYLTISGLEKLSTLNGYLYSELPTNIQMSFSKRPFRIVVLTDKSDYKARIEMFERLNTGGVSLTPMEVRACIFRGGFLELIETLAQNQKFGDLLKLTESNKEDMTKEEIVLKFFAFLENRAGFDGNVKIFLDDFAEDFRSKPSTKERTKIFEASVSALSKIMNGKPFLRTNVRVTPINQLEGVLVGIADLINAGKTPKAKTVGWFDDAELIANSTQGTNSRKKLIGRINRAKELLG